MARMPPPAALAVVIRLPLMLLRAAPTLPASMQPKRGAGWL